MIKLFIQNTNKKKRELNLSVYCDQQIELKPQNQEYSLKEFIYPYYESACVKAKKHNAKYQFDSTNIFENEVWLYYYKNYDKDQKLVVQYDVSED